MSVIEKIIVQENLFKREALLIENDFLQSKLYRDILDFNNFEVSLVKSGVDGLRKIREKKYDVAIMNVDIGQEPFVEKLLQKVHEESPFLPIIGLSIYESRSKKSVSALLNKFLTKPFSIDTLIECVVVCVENGCENSYCGRAQI